MCVLLRGKQEGQRENMVMAAEVGVTQSHKPRNAGQPLEQG